MIIYGIDPGTYESALVGIDSDYKVVEILNAPNPIIEERLEELNPNITELAIEFVQSYGMSVGRETFITVRWVGRFERAFDDNLPDFRNKVFFYARPTIRAHICSGIVKIKDKDIRAALVMRFGDIKKGHPLEGLKNTHLRSAMAVAVTHQDGSKLGSEDWMRLDDKDKKTKKKKKAK